MPRRAPDAPVTLPESIPELRRVLARATAKQRQAIGKAIEDAYCGFRGMSGRARPPRTAPYRLFEERTLELLRTPIIDASRRLDWAQVGALTNLCSARSPAAPAVCRRYLRSRWPDVRGWAAEHLARLGFDSQLPLVLRLIRSRDSALATSTIEGTFMPLTSRWASRRYRRAILSALVPLVTGERRVPRTEAGRDLLTWAVKALADLDKSGARRLFASGRCLHPGNQALWSILWQVQSWQEENPRRHRRPIRPETLWMLFDAAAAGRAATFPGWSAGRPQVGVLFFTAGIDPARTRRECATLRKRYPKDEFTQKDVKRVLRRCRRLPEAHACLMWLYDNPGRLPPAAAEVMRAYELATYVAGDGLDGYLSDMSEQFRAAVRGLHRLGARRALVIVKEAARLVHPRGVPADQQRALTNSVAMSKSRQAELEQVQERYWAVHDAVLAAVDRYIAAHAGQFRTVPR